MTGHPIRPVMVYSWRLLTIPEWKEREKRLLTQYWGFYGFVGNAKSLNSRKRYLKNNLIASLSSSREDILFGEIAYRIESRHEKARIENLNSQF